jgi:hypothetical protein
MSKKLEGLGLNGIKLKWIIGTYGNWKNQNPGGHLELNIGANLAHFLDKWAG